MSPTPAEFIDRWKDSAGAELANSQSFLNELCDLLGVPHPDPSQADEERNEYVFEKTVLFNDLGSDSRGRIDLYRKDCFVLESKQGVERQEAREDGPLSDKKANARRKVGTALRGTSPWAVAMQKAAGQARRYAAAVEHGWPPFLIVVDVGYCFDLYADFSRTGKSYQPFPDTQSFRIRLADLAGDETRDLLRTIWTDPLSLDPTKRSAAVTRRVAARLAELAKRLEREYAPDRVAQFLMRCLFTMFAEDIRIGNFPENGFTDFLKSRREKLDRFVPSLENLWQAMDRGTYSDAVEAKLARFNGGLFADCEALPLTDDQLELLIEAADSQWEHVEPAIFGTLLERALDPVERHKLGAHYTPRAYVERLVLPTVIEPLRDDWQATYAAAVARYQDGDKAEAIKLVGDWHQTLCDVSVLDPACGTGNFLYVALELIKRLEGEVLLALKEFGGAPPLHHVRPPQFHGIEVNPRAAAIADLVLEIGYLQWQVRSVGREHVNEPILDKERSIECRDALLVWDGEEDVLDADGAPVTRWDGRTTKPSPVTGEEIPDETARVVERRYLNPRKAEWPKADYIVGNPPFIGNKRMRFTLGNGYTTQLRTTYKELPESCDFVMYWWHKAAEIVRAGGTKRFGFITTNSIRQAFNRRIVEPHLAAKNPVSILFAVPDHPWVDSEDGAAVRISMSVATFGRTDGTSLIVVNEQFNDTEDASIEFESSVGRVSSSLTTEVDVAAATPLAANRGISNRGMTLVGAGFLLDSKDLSQESLRHIPLEPPVFRFVAGRDLAQSPRTRYVIDFYGLTEAEARHKHPALYQRLFDRVRPERLENTRASYREKWWVFAEPRGNFRPALKGIHRYIVTPRTAKHRFFQFVDSTTVVESEIVPIASDSDFVLGVLSSLIHVTWALATGGHLGVGNDPRYNKSLCFETFPFPVPDEATKQRIRELGEQLDAHRKRQQELHPTLTMTGMYNVLEKLRSGEVLSKKEQTIHEQGLVSVLKQIHDDLDAAVAAAYGWPADLDDEAILQRLVDLNRERAEEERRGLIRWLRPEFQNPQANDSTAPGKTQRDLVADEETDEEEQPPVAVPAKKVPWPTEKDRQPHQERVRLLRQALSESARPLSSDEIAGRFSKANKKKVHELLETLVAVGQARVTPDERYAL